jgi:hypothetical protein
MRKLVVFTILLTVFFGCQQGIDAEKGEVVAKVRGEYLYEADLKNAVSPGTSKNDSIMMARKFIDNWVRRQLLLNQAKKNLQPSQLDFKKQIEEYRNSLIVYAYETELIKQKLDTIVEESQIVSYYENNKANFELKYNVVKAFYVVLPLKSEQKELFVELMQNPDTLYIDSLNNLASTYALSSFISEDWIRFDDLMTSVPIDTYNQEAFLKKNRFVEIEDDSVIYLLRIDDYLLSENISPLEIEHERIRNILLYKRKMDLIKDLNEQLFENALRNNDFEIYK